MKEILAPPVRRLIKNYEKHISIRSMQNAQALKKWEVLDDMTIMFPPVNSST